MTNSAQGLLIVLSGPSGVGKGAMGSTLLKEDPNICYTVSVTTRQPRKGEKEGQNYYYISREEFFRRRDNGDFLEWAEVYGNYYGTLHSEVDRLLQDGKTVILEIDTQGAMQIKAAYPSGVLVFVLPPSLAELKRRIVARGSETAATLKLRLSQAEQEIAMAEQYDYTIINDNLKKAVSELRAVIAQEKANRSCP